MKCSVKLLVGHIFDYKRLVFLGQIIAVVATILISVIPLFIPLLVDELLLGKEHKLTYYISSVFGEMEIYQYVLIILIIIIVFRFVATVLGILQTKIFVTISKKITYKLRVSLLDHLKRVSLKEYENFSVGSITSKLVTDIETLDGFIGTTVGKLIIAVLTLLFSGIILLWIHWPLALFILITNPIVVFFTAKLSRRIGVLKKDENRAVGEFQGSLSDTLELFHQIKATNKEGYFFDKVNGLMLAIFSYLWIMVGPTQDVINFQYTLSTAKTACERINEVFAMQQEEHKENALDPFENKEAISITLKNLYFAYDKDSILKNINMDIKAGEKVAIVGSSGSGKSTLANIIVGFYPIAQGDILYGGVSIKDINLATVREHIHLILQQPKLFNDTIRFNLTLGAQYSESQIEEAIKIAQLEDVIAGLKNGVDTIVGRDGIKLSGGQRQRIAIARMVLVDPEVVIFDESTSALDTHTEGRLFGRLFCKYEIGKEWILFKRSS
ncbi:MAG: ABC transporter ATP-binding protein [Sulfurovaceae bacterium]